MARAKAVLPNLAYHADPYETLEGADAALVCTEWQQFREFDWKRAGRLMAQRLVIEGRNLYSPKTRGADVVRSVVTPFLSATIRVRHSDQMYP
jgi:hypothetical protein